MDANPVRVLVVDDHDGFRSCMVEALDLVPGVEVAGEACSGDEACRAVLTLKPDLVLLDLSMPGMNSMDAARTIRRSNPDSQVMVLTALEDPAVEEEVVAAGAVGLIPKGTPLDDMVDALRYAVAHPREELANGAGRSAAS
ncbi:MAG TPA: response regulator transcription factor [Actinomycetota bacterium]|nr:response regulator transcription factor [Actinomycetota bacterium]